MPVLFLDPMNPNGTIVQRIAYDTMGWTEEDLRSGIVVDSIPEPENNGKIATLHINKDTKEIWYEYEEAPKSEIEVLRDENRDLKIALGESVEAQQQDKIENQLAIAELVETLTTKGVL
ncbi:hypothetical protein [Lysinibacillus sphaericus]|uniref:hypothetical protein n=1 Tax=Lysinibacillus sphaericus TaxID=1421 RepID=UPI000C190B3D|nr:hypothetical protein [Lysinibacillus sphaericus]PIJ99965.1 hypothetical protein CTN02_03230 [Lysinibacillus sphaericus]